MKNKGFTLVELIATLVVLSVIAVLIIPNVYDYLNEAKSGIKATQLESIVDSAKEWAADNIDKLPSNDDEVIYVFLQDLQAGGYIDYDLYKNTEGEMYNDNIFVLIECEVVEADEFNNENYKYTYTIYNTNEKHLKYLATLYAIKNNVTTTTNVTLSDILPYANINLVVGNKLKNIEDGTLVSTANLKIDYDNNLYKISIMED